MSGRLWIAATIVGLFAVVSTPNVWDRPYYPDGAHEKYTAVAAWSGGDPYQTLDELADTYGFAHSGHPAPSPRPPAALLMQGPMVLLADGWIIPVIGVVSVASILFACWATTKIARVPEWLMAVVAALLAVSADLWYANSGIVVAAMLAGGWLLRRSPWGAVLFGAAAAVKVWPALLMVTLLVRRDTRKIGWSALAAAAAFTGVGLLLPAVSIEGTVTAGTEALSYFVSGSMNLSLAGFAARSDLSPYVGVAVGLGVWALTTRITRTPDEAIAWAIIFGILASPQSSPIYWVGAVPALALLVRTLLSARSPRTLSESREESRRRPAIPTSKLERSERPGPLAATFRG